MNIRLRRPRGRVILSAAIALALMSGSAVAFALWRAEVDRTAQVALGAKVGFSVGRVGAAGEAASGPTEQLELWLTRQDATDLLNASSRTLAVPIKVQLRADGNLGMTYSVGLPSYAGDSVFGASTLRLFPLPSTTDNAAVADCRADAAPASQPGTDDILGIAAGNPAQTLATDYWCLTVVYSSGGSYQNTATVSASATPTPAPGADPTVTAAPTAVSAEDSWQAFVVEEGDYVWSHTVTTPL